MPVPAAIVAAATAFETVAVVAALVVVAVVAAVVAAIVVVALVRHSELELDCNLVQLAHLIAPIALVRHSVRLPRKYPPLSFLLHCFPSIAVKQLAINSDRSTM